MAKATTYKRRTKSGKTITVTRKASVGVRAAKKPGIAKRTVKGTGRLIVSGSTRYTTKGANPKRKLKRLKTYGTTTVGSMAGSAVGSRVGSAAGQTGAAVGGLAGGIAGAAAGRKVARSRGWQKRTKKRMTVRAVNNYKAKRKKGGK